ncbi:MAG: tRNA preQ1(34) S-adenosylmethionine ribosyltransferase-isomerase QueA [Myxococcota bacterium]|nr:tRNA preQ1(34) S-adenosylmethionine ribosyltransferase-isomerase QueA [Myxococcota bacterium]
MSEEYEHILSRYDFNLPDSLVAIYPPEKREGGRLLLLRENDPCDDMIQHLPNMLESGDLLVVNNTKVMFARISARRKTGGKVEVFITKILGEHECIAMIRPGRRIKIGEELRVCDQNEEIIDGYSIECCEREQALWKLKLYPGARSLMNRCGKIPIPPYLNREANEEDRYRYQTVFAGPLGAVAAPTAGLHLSKDLLFSLKSKGIRIAEITLHVGMGTFAPLRPKNIQTGLLHSEMYAVSPETAEAVRQTKRLGKRVIAVGTTVTRCLESLALEGDICDKIGETSLFIREDFSFQVIDGLLTNFHLPKSSLLMLVCAFGGYDRVLRAYKHAIQQQYRFYSYGDAMLLFPK